jgi:predicted ATP-dependent endonuclease of OLD family
MRLVSAKVGPYKSIEKPIDVQIGSGVTVFVGMNESGKTVFLEALQKSDDVFGLAKFDHVDDYTRKNLGTYEKRHEKTPDTATVLTYEITDKEAEEINRSLHTQLRGKFQFSIFHDYKNKKNDLITCR